MGSLCYRSGTLCHRHRQAVLVASGESRPTVCETQGRHHPCRILDSDCTMAGSPGALESGLGS